MRTRTRSVTTIDVDGIEVELDMTPDCEPTVVQPTPTTLVVGYLMYDSDCENPMTNWDGEGKLYTTRPSYGGGGSITDDPAAPSYLGLSGFAYRGELEYDLELDGIQEKVAEKVKAAIKADKDLSVWMVKSIMACDAPMEDLINDLVSDQFEGSNYAKFDWSSEEDEEMLSLLGSYEDLAKSAWEDLYAEGKIGDYLAVPVRYYDSVHGPGTAQMYVCHIDDANAVWVPGKYEIANMSLRDDMTHAEKMEVAEKYAAGCLSTYEKWCNGDCYGVVVEAFELVDGEYVRLDTDSCWGYIGSEWADESVREQMGYWESKFKEKEAA
jgi:hypothetical protein